jgi:FKBP-type peptidyl-prolyl cis-trans isomerase
LVEPPAFPSANNRLPPGPVFVTRDAHNLKPPMKPFIALLLLVTLAFGVLAQNQTATNPPPPDAKSVSYALGVNFGLGLSNTMHFLGATNIDTNILMGAIADALAGRKPQMTQKEAMAITNAWNVSQRREMVVQNLAASRAYIDKFSKEPGVKELTNGIYYRVVKEGDGPHPGLTDTVAVDYVGRLVDGSVFDSSFSHEQRWDPQVNHVIKGWTIALQAMTVGSKWDLVVSPELAYGERGTGAAVPPNSAFVYELTLLAIKSTNAPAGDAAPAMRSSRGMTNSPSSGR